MKQEWAVKKDIPGDKLIELFRDMRSLQLEIEKEEADKKLSMKHYDTRIKSLMDEVSPIRDKIYKGYDVEIKWCNVENDFRNNKRKVQVLNENDEVIEEFTEDLDNEEIQLTI